MRSSVSVIFLMRLALAIAGLELDTELLLLRCAIRRIGEIGRLVLHVVDGPVDLLHELTLPVEQHVAEVVELRRTHVGFVFSRVVGREVLERRIARRKRQGFDVLGGHGPSWSQTCSFAKARKLPNQTWVGQYSCRFFYCVDGEYWVRFEPPLLPGVLVRRYKRFLADVEVAGAGVVTMHCANTGAMLGCDTPGSPVWYSTSPRRERKYAHSLEIVETESGARICVNTARANAVVAEALAAGRIPELTAERVRREVRIPDVLAEEEEKGQRKGSRAHGRFDFGLYRTITDPEPSTYVEVKSVTLARGSLGAFPDAVSERARRHVEALARCVAVGRRGVLLYCVPHTDIRRVTPADDIDPEYGKALRRAVDAGVEVMAYGCTVSPREITLDGALDVVL